MALCRSAGACSSSCLRPKMLCDVATKSPKTAARQQLPGPHSSSQSPEQGPLRSASPAAGDQAGSAARHEQQKPFSPVRQNTQGLGGLQLRPGGLAHCAWYVQP